MVPNQLLRLAGSDRIEAFAASHDLWCGLCHQHVQVGSAALPALPFLLEVLDSADRNMAAELLDILWGVSKGVNRQRSRQFQRAIGRNDHGVEEQWIADLRTSLLGELPRFEELVNSTDEEIADFARQIIKELREERDDE